MASTSSKVWITLAAAFGTLVIASVVVSAPSVQRCQGQTEGLWSCLRGELIEFGLLRDETPIPATAILVPEQPAPPVASPVVALPAPAEPAPLPAADGAPEPVPALPAEPAVATAPEPPPPAVPPAMQPQAAASGATGIAADAAISPDLSPSQFGVALAPALGIRIALAGDSLRLLPPPAALTPPAIPAPEPVPPAVLPLAPDAAIEPPLASAPVLTPPAEALAPEIVPEIAPTAGDDPAVASAPLAAASDTPAGPAAPELPLADAPEATPPAEPEPPPGPTLIASATASVSPGASAAIAPTIDAVEIDGSSSFIAGAGTDGSTVNLYVGKQYIGSAEVEGGRWVFQTRGTIALDQLRVALAPEAQGRAWLGTQSVLSFNVAPTGVRLVGSKAAAELLQPAAQSELELTPTNPTLQAFVSVDPELLRFRSGKAIIRRGDTLWAIARRVYGRGALYPRIFEANRELIRSPGRIFPGQVLLLPRAD